MALWRKKKDKTNTKSLDEAWSEIEGRHSEGSLSVEKKEEPYHDILNDFRAMERQFKEQEIISGRGHPITKTYFFHLHRRSVWGCGYHPPLPYPIELEPPYHFLRVQDAESYEDAPPLHPRRCAEGDPRTLCCFTIAMSPDDNITASEAEQFWLSLKNISQPVSFEVVANTEEIIFQFLCHPNDKQYIASQMVAYCPEAEINPEGTDPDYLLELWEQLEPTSTPAPWEFCLSHFYHRPLRTFTRLDPDPLNALVSAIGDLREYEGAIFQALITPARRDWKRGLLETYFTEDPWSVFLIDLVTPESPQLAREKLRSYPFFAVALRMMVLYMPGAERLSPLREEMVKFIDLYESEHNYLATMDCQQYPDYTPLVLSETLINAILRRQTHRGGMILNPRELAGICHFPAKSLRHPKLLRATHARAKAPDIALQEGALIGVNEVHGKRKEVSIPKDRRDLHTYIVGATGTGKSTLLLNMIVQDIDNGEGVGVIDPHGDLISEILPRIPDERIDDVVLFDPADTEYPICLNLLSASDFRETDLVCSDLLAVFQRMFDAASWGDNIEQILRMCILSLLEAKGYTLRDIRRLITNEVFRSEVVSSLSDPDLVEFWVAEFPSYSKATIGAVQRRLSRVLFTPLVRNILSQAESKLDFLDIMDNRKILLCNLSKGNIGQDNSDLFGQLLVSKIQISSMARANRPMEERQPFYLYVDEFQNFVTSSFEEILSEARKYQLCLILANQFTRQLSKRVHDAVFGNVGTLVTFRLGLDDAQDLQKELGKFTYENILNLEPYHTYVRIGRAQDAFSMVTLPPPEERDPDIAEGVREASRRKYATPRAEVEAYLTSQIQAPPVKKPKDAKGDEDGTSELEFFEEE